MMSEFAVFAYCSENWPGNGPKYPARAVLGIPKAGTRKALVTKALPYLYLRTPLLGKKEIKKRRGEEPQSARRGEFLLCFNRGVPGTEVAR